MTGRILIHSRRHFHKRFDLAGRVLPEVESVAPMERDEFLRWHFLQSVRAMGAATETDLRMYMTFPRMKVAERRRTLEALVRGGEVVEVGVRGDSRRWLARREDLEALAAAARRRRPSTGTTLLSPFDSLLWHRERARTLFGFDYRIEVYTPGHKRVHGYYTLPILHDGMLVGRVDAKNYREAGRLEVRSVHVEPWVTKGGPPHGATWPAPESAALATGIGDAVKSLATFTGATDVTLGRVSPLTWRTRLAAAIG
jgi:hypothetical protein